MASTNLDRPASLEQTIVAVALFAAALGLAIWWFGFR